MFSDCYYCPPYETDRPDLRQEESDVAVSCCYSSVVCTASVECDHSYCQIERVEILEMTEEKEVDIYRDTPVRLLGYANEVGEAFRALVHVRY